MIYVKTEQGQAAFQSRSVSLTPRQRAAFILFDGKRAASEVLASTVGMGVTEDDLAHLIAAGVLAPGAVSQPPTVAKDPEATVLAPLHSAALAYTADGQPTANAQAHYSKAYPIATRLTAGLGLRGFRLNLAVESATDLDKLKELAPKIREAVGPEKFLELENALYY